MFDEIGGAPLVAGLCMGWLGAGAAIYWWIDTMGLWLAIIMAVITALTVMRTWMLRTQRAFIHGWHAGWHDAHEGSDGEQCESYPCGIIDLAGERNQRLNQLTGS